MNDLMMGALTFVGLGAVVWWVERPSLAPLRRLFRRTPPHLRGRMPVECGEGTRATIPDGTGIRRVGIMGDYTPPPDEVGRAFLRSVDPIRSPDEFERVHGPFDVRTMTYSDGTTRHQALTGLVRRTMGEPLHAALAGQRPSPTLQEALMLRAQSEPMPPYAVALTSARTKAERAGEAGLGVAWVTADEWRAVYFTVVMRPGYNPPEGKGELVLHTPRGTVRLEIEPTPEEAERGRCKPEPAENAKRYTDEGGTW